MSARPPWLRRVFLGLALLVAVGAGFLVPTIWGKPWSIDHFFTRELVFLALDHPMLLSFARVLDPWGLDYYSDDLEDFSLDADQRELARADQVLRGLREFADDGLSESQRLSYDILEWFLQQQKAGAPFVQHAYPVNAFDGSQGFLPDFMLNIHQIHDLEDAENYLTRIQKMGPAVEQLVVRLEEAAAEGIVPPNFILARTREGMAEFTKPEPGSNSLVAKLARRSDELTALADAKGGLVARAVAIVSEDVLPAYAQLDQQLERMEESASADAGVWKLPDGDAYYRWVLRGHTTTSMSPEEIHAAGRSEVERIHGEMRRLFAERGTPTDDPAAGLKALTLEASQRYPANDQGRAEILADHQAVIDEVWGRLGEWFPRVPRAPVSVERVPLFREAGSAGAYYLPPPLDGSKPGVFYKNLANVEESPRFSLRTLTYHEAVPGHHLQIALAMESEELPHFRRFLPFTAFSEGWALYAERLADEVGLFPTLEDRLGQLQAENFRAVRLIVDTGLHAKKWSRQRAIDTMVDLTGMARSDVTREVERYVVAPGQACAYKVGQLKILQLRARAREQLGDAFDLRAFHGLVLDGGARPLEILEQEVDRWIEAQRQAP